MLEDTQPRFRFSRPQVRFEDIEATELSEAKQDSGGSERSDNESSEQDHEIVDFVRLPDTNHATSSALNGSEEATSVDHRLRHALPVVSVLDERLDGNCARSYWWKEWWRMVKRNGKLIWSEEV